MSEMIFQDVGIYMYDIKDYLSKKKITRWSILEGGGGVGQVLKNLWSKLEFIA